MRSRLRGGRFFFFEVFVNEEKWSSYLNRMAYEWHFRLLGFECLVEKEHVYNMPWLWYLAGMVISEAMFTLSAV